MPPSSGTLFDASEPRVMVVAVDDGEILLGQDGVIGIPSSAEPQVTVYWDTDGSWKLEEADAAEARAIIDGHMFQVAGRTFRFSAPALVRSTASAVATSVIGLIFQVSTDEEFVELALECEGRVVALGSRAHNYLLLHLARRRLSDIQEELPDTECGWVEKDELASALETTAQQIDGEVFRIRKHFGQRGLREAATIIERRPGSRQLRIGIGRIAIRRGGLRAV